MKLCETLEHGIHLVYRQAQFRETGRNHLDHQVLMGLVEALSRYPNNSENSFDINNWKIQDIYVFCFLDIFEPLFCLKLYS